MFPKLYCVKEVSVLNRAEIHNIFEDYSITEIANPQNIGGVFLQGVDLINIFISTMNLVDIKIKNPYFRKVVELLQLTPLDAFKTYEKMREDKGIAFDAFYDTFIFEAKDGSRVPVNCYHFAYTGDSLDQLAFQMNIAYYEGEGGK